MARVDQMSIEERCSASFTTPHYTPAHFHGNAGPLADTSLTCKFIIISLDGCHMLD